VTSKGGQIHHCHIHILSKIAVSSVDRLLADEILAKLKCVAARYNGEDTPDKCMDGTRIEVIKKIIGHLTATPSSSQRLLMLSGSAGSGKSTIAKSVASILGEQKNALAASFFFSRDYAERNGIRYVPTTLARQLGDYNPDFRRLLVKFLDDDRTGILSAEPRLQFQKLVIEILAKIPQNSKPWVICLDALDECGLDRGQTFLRWLSDGIASVPVHVRFFLTGRPDVPSYLKFDSLHLVMRGIILDDIESATVDRDIHLYVQQSLDGRNWTTRRDWKVRMDDVDEITSRAGGLFIFAATAVRYVVAGSAKVSPQRAVDYLLRGAPLVDLHDLYSRIMDEAITIPPPSDDLAQDFYRCARRVLATIFHLVEPLGSQSLAALLDIDVEDLRSTLNPLSAVIRVPETLGDVVQIRHLSFREFMTSKIQETRSDLLCGTEEQQCSLVSDMLCLMDKELQFNICQLPTSYLRNREISDLPTRLERYVPDHLRYSCRFWVDHLVATTYRADCVEKVAIIFYEKFLFWLEVMSLLGMMSFTPLALSKLIVWVNVCQFFSL
jgi:energy-coupling factor transporter ATP-binding protein EcfA2